jgi:hypothetical protein
MYKGWQLLLILLVRVTEYLMKYSACPLHASCNYICSVQIQDMLMNSKWICPIIILALVCCEDCCDGQGQLHHVIISATRGHHPCWQTPCLHRPMCRILNNKIIQINYKIQNIGQLFSKKLQGTCFCSTSHMSCGCKQFKTAKWHSVHRLQSCQWSQFFVWLTFGYECTYFVLV